MSDLMNYFEIVFWYYNCFKIQILIKDFFQMNYQYMNL